MRWIKLCEPKKGWQTYQTENLSKTNFESRKIYIINQSAALSQMRFFKTT